MSDSNGNVFNLVDKTNIGTALKALAKEGPNIEGLICGYRTKDGACQVIFANLDPPTASYLINILQWSLQQSSCIAIEGMPK